jgi:hypothetical protein
LPRRRGLGSAMTLAGAWSTCDLYTFPAP